MFSVWLWFHMGETTLTERQVETESPTLPEQVIRVITLSDDQRLVELCIETIFGEGIADSEVQELYDLVHSLHQTTVRSSSTSLSSVDKEAIVAVKEELAERGAEAETQI